MVIARASDRNLLYESRTFAEVAAAAELLGLGRALARSAGSVIQESARAKRLTPDAHQHALRTLLYHHEIERAFASPEERAAVLAAFRDHLDSSPLVPPSLAPEHKNGTAQVEAAKLSEFAV